MGKGVLPLPSGGGGGGSVGGGRTGGGGGERAPYGSQAGAEALRARAEQLQSLRANPNEGTVGVARVYNTSTKRYEIWVTVAGKSDASSVWATNPLQDNEIFKPGGSHAERNVFGHLGRFFKIVEAGTSRNICKDVCDSEIQESGLFRGGIARPGARHLTPHRTFWHLNPDDPVHTTPAVFRASLGRLGGRALGALNILGTALDVYSYFQYEKPLADQGWTACTDQATGMPKIPVSLCPPTGAGGPPVG